MPPADLPAWWVTVVVDRTRTVDRVVKARSAWSAGWLMRQLDPGVEILAVRPVERR